VFEEEWALRRATLSDHQLVIGLISAEYLLTRFRPTRMALDLVCRMDVDYSGNSRYFSEYGEKKYFFCSAECKRKFDDHPDAFIQQKAKEDAGMA
jgi:YHS domain-containing protein